MTDYTRYQFSLVEYMVEILRIVIILGATGWLFFGSWIGSLVLMPAGILLLKERKEKKKQERLSRLRTEFGEFIVSFSSSVQAGFTVERAIAAGAEDLQRIYADKDSVLVRELNWMESQMKLQISGEDLFFDLAKRSGLEEIRSFAVVLNVGKRQGGNLVEITRRTADHMNRRIQVQMEVEESIAGRVMEKNIMFAMPYFMLVYLRFTNDAYLDILMSDFIGKGILLLCLIFLWLAGQWADRIVQVQM